MRFHDENHAKPWLLPLLILLGAAVAMAAEQPRETALTLSDGDGNQLFSRPIGIGERFSVIFTHSLALSPVEEIFEVVAADEFRLRETIYADFGAGLPHEELPGQRMEFSDGRIRLYGYDVPFGEVRLRVGHIADHRLKLPDGDIIFLKNLARPGAEIRIAVEH